MAWKEHSVITDETTTTITRNEFFAHNYTNIDFWIHVWFTTKLPTRPSNKSIRNMIDCIRQSKHISTNLNKIFTAKITEPAIILKQVG